MRLRIEFNRYESKLATFISLMKSGIVGFIFTWIAFNIPSFIVLACGVTGGIVGIVFAVMTILSIIAEILIIKYADPDKIEQKYLEKTSKSTAIEEISPEQMQVLQKIIQENKEKQIQDAKMRAYIGTQIAEDNQKQDNNNS